MYELIKLSDICYYVQCPAKAGVILTGENEICLIDSGSDKEAGKKIKKLLDANGWTLKAIFSTHSHADHIGGNQYLQKHTGCAIFAPGTECDISNDPILEPWYLYGGNPPKELRHKFLMAQPSEVAPLLPGRLPEALEAFPLPGHSRHMVGYRTKDDIVFLADCLSSKETLEKYKIGFIADIGKYLETLKTVKTMKAKLFVPSHAEPTDDIVPLADYNIRAVNEIADAIVSLCSSPVSFDTILKRLFEIYGLTMTFEQHALVGSTLRSYLTWLADLGRLTAEINDNTLTWRI
ncbi:MAG: MBL fold metallo-hydrolase [Clostridia bacterium]|nr:MBL fold metallo-hydrolase [Clostridia bacterium]